MNKFIVNIKYSWALLLMAWFVSGILSAQFKPISDGTITVEGREWITKDIGEVYTPSVYSYDDLNGTWRIYGSALDFARTTSDDVGPTVLTQIPNGDWELIVRVISPDYIAATGYAFREVWLDDGTGTGTLKLYYPGEVLAPQPRFTSNHKYGILIRENLNQRCREVALGSGNLQCRLNYRKDYAEDEEGKIITNSLFQYSGSARSSAESRYPTWLRIVKRGNNWNTYYAMTTEDISYESADDVKWTVKNSFSMDLDSANIYAGLFFGSGWNTASRGSNYEVRDPRATQTYDNLILRPAPPLWQLANPLADQEIVLGAWLEKNVTNMFDHDLKDDLNYKVESSNENVAFAYIDVSTASDGTSVRTLKIKGISAGVAKMRLWWDVGGYHLEDVFYVNVKEASAAGPQYRTTLLNHVNIGGDPSASVIASDVDDNGTIRILRNAGGNNHSAAAKTMTDAALYFPMEWDGTADSIEVVYKALSDTRFYATAGLAILQNLSNTSTAAGVGEYTTVSGGIGWQTSYFFTRTQGSTALGMTYSPGHKSGDSQTSPNQVLWETQLKLVRRSATTIDMYSKRPDDVQWDFKTVEIAEMGDYYFILNQSQTRAGLGSFFRDLKINGQEIYLAGQDVKLHVGTQKRITIFGHFGEKLGENWSNIAVKSSNESKFSATIQGGDFVVTNISNDENAQDAPVKIIITADKDGEQMADSIYASTKPYSDMEYVDLGEFLQNDNTGRIKKGETDSEFFFTANQNRLGESSEDKSVFLYENIAATDSSDITVFVSEFSNSGEESKGGLMLWSDNMNGSEAYVALLVTPEEGLKFQYRWKEATDAVVEDVELQEGVVMDLKAPIYLKIRKIGKWFYPYVSKDGATWHIARKYAFPLEMLGQAYHAGFAVATSANFGLPAKAHITDFVVTVGDQMSTLSDVLPQFKSLEIDQPILKKEDPLKPQVKVFMTQYNAAVAECQITEEGELKATLYALSGKTVRQYGSVNLNEGRHRVSYNLSGLPKGIYLIKVETSIGTVVEKVFVQ